MPAGNPNFNTAALAFASNKWLQKKTTDNIGKADATLYKLIKKGRVGKAIYGGNKLLEPIRYGFNTTVTGLDAQDTVVPLNQQTGFTDAEYTWSKYGGNTVFFRDELNICSKDATGVAMLDLVRERTEQTAESFVNKILTDLYGTTTATNGKIMGLGYALHATAYGSQTQTVGGITKNGTDNLWWNHRTITQSEGMGGTDGTIADGIRYLISLATFYAKPDLVVTPLSLWNVMAKQERTLQRYVGTNAETAAAGFENILVGGVEVVWSRYMTDEGGPTSTTYGSAGNQYTGNLDGHCFALTTEHMALRTQGGTPFEPQTTKYEGVPEQPGVGMVFTHYLECALTFSSMRTHGRMFAWDHDV